MTARLLWGAVLTGTLALAVWLALGAWIPGTGATTPGAFAAAVESATEAAGSGQGGIGTTAAVPAPALAAGAAAPGATGATGAATGATGAAAAAAPGSAAVDLVDAAWAQRVAAATGIPVRAVQAYAAAALRTAAEQPGCGLGWNTLAALGAVESGHGTHEGSRLDAHGRATPAITGPPLDGGLYDGIHDSDGGALDGDTAWDRAVGPLQFIPTTWARWGADASGDGVADPQQIDDAALAAARYLCHSGPLTTTGGWRAAVFSYNHVDSYVDLVAATATEYAVAADGV